MYCNLFVPVWNGVRSEQCVYIRLHLQHGHARYSVTWRNEHFPTARDILSLLTETL